MSYTVLIDLYHIIFRCTDYCSLRKICVLLIRPFTARGREAYCCKIWNEILSAYRRHKCGVLHAPSNLLALVYNS